MSESRFAGRSFYLESPEGAEQLGADYDEHADVLYLWRGDAPAEAVSFTTESGPIMRFDPTTGVLVGVTLLDFSTCWAEKTRIDLAVPAFGATEGRAAKTVEHRELVLA